MAHFLGRWDFPVIQGAGPSHVQCLQREPRSNKKLLQGKKLLRSDSFETSQSRTTLVYEEGGEEIEFDGEDPPTNDVEESDMLQRSQGRKRVLWRDWVNRRRTQTLPPPRIARSNRWAIQGSKDIYYAG
ncbi:hypothetical protein HAX54_047540, partial [Datura stramonium]|nr:hypothetical protein [Datura stramonium]